MAATLSFKARVASAPKAASAPRAQPLRAAARAQGSAPKAAAAPLSAGKQALAALALAVSISASGVVAPEPAHAGYAGLTPCSSNKVRRGARGEPRAPRIQAAASPARRYDGGAGEILETCAATFAGRSAWRSGGKRGGGGASNAASGRAQGRARRGWRARRAARGRLVCLRPLAPLHGAGRAPALRVRASPRPATATAT